MEAQRPQTDGVPDGDMDVSETERLHEPQHRHELSLAPSAHPGLQQTAQGAELLGEVPTHKWRRLVQSTGLALQQRKVVDRVEHEVVALIRAAVSGYHLRSAANDHLIHIPPDQHLPVSVGHGHRVVVGAVPDQRQRDGITWVVCLSLASYGTAGRGQKGVEVGAAPCARLSSHSVLLKLSPPSDPGTSPPGATSRVESLEALKRRDGHKEVASAVSHPYPTIPSTFPLSLPLPGRPNLSSKR